MKQRRTDMHKPEPSKNTFQSNDIYWSEYIIYTWCPKTHTIIGGNLRKRFVASAWLVSQWETKRIIWIVKMYLNDKWNQSGLLQFDWFRDGKRWLHLHTKWYHDDFHCRFIEQSKMNCLALISEQPTSHTMNWNKLASTCVSHYKCLCLWVCMIKRWPLHGKSSMCAKRTYKGWGRTIEDDFHMLH